MQPLPPPPASPIPPSPLLQAQRQIKPLSLNQIIVSKYAQNHDALVPVPSAANHESRKSEKQPMLRTHQGRRTNPLVWFGAIACLVFSLIVIFFGIATLITFLVVRPRTPLFDISNAKLSTIYFESPEYFNGEFSFLANFSNPNRKIDVRFEYLQMELYFSDSLIARQPLEPFTQRPREGRLQAVHLVSSSVYLPQNHALALRTQVQNNKVEYNIRGTLKVKASLGVIHYSYWLHSRCQLQMTGPPTGGLVGRSCRTKR